MSYNIGLILIHAPVVLPRPEVSVEVCSSAPLEVEALKLAVVLLLASPGKVTVVNLVKSDENYVESDIIQ